MGSLLPYIQFMDGVLSVHVDTFLENLKKKRSIIKLLIMNVETKVDVCCGMLCRGLTGLT